MSVCFTPRKCVFAAGRSAVTCPGVQGTSMFYEYTVDGGGNKMLLQRNNIRMIMPYNVLKSATDVCELCLGQRGRQYLLTQVAGGKMSTALKMHICFSPFPPLPTTPI